MSKDGGWTKSSIPYKATQLWCQGLGGMGCLRDEQALLERPTERPRQNAGRQACAWRTEQGDGENWPSTGDAKVSGGGAPRSPAKVRTDFGGEWLCVAHLGGFGLGCLREGKSVAVGQVGTGSGTSCPLDGTRGVDFGVGTVSAF